MGIEQQKSYFFYTLPGPHPSLPSLSGFASEQTCFNFYASGTLPCLSVSRSWNTTPRTRGGQEEAELCLGSSIMAPTGKAIGLALALQRKRELQRKKRKRT